jgi:cobyrinic acid a,c-diamide synthase
MESVAATALGFRDYASEVGRDVDVVGVVAQRAHGGRHEASIRDALPDGLAYFGRIPPRADLEIPDRHLGLQMGEEATLDGAALDEATETIRTDRLVEVARSPPRPGAIGSGPDTDARVAVARDAAFCFAYPATIERLRDRAEVVTFSPLGGDDLPACDGLYLPGGYPELHASTLEASATLDDIADSASDGTAILGECGGLMTLSRSLTTSDGERHEMAGVLPADVRMHDRSQALDHVELRARTDTVTALADETRRGHEFHYSSADPDPDARFAFEVLRGEGIADERDGLTEYRTLGTYCHLHAESGAFDAFVERAASGTG